MRPQKILLWKRLSNLFRHPAFLSLTVVGNGFIVLFATLFYLLEHPTNPKVAHIVDALWWAVTTVTTVGYGDILPITTAGRWLGMATMIFGSALFCSFTALFATSLMAPHISEMQHDLRHVEEDLKDVEKKDQDLKHTIENLERTIALLKKNR